MNLTHLPTFALGVVTIGALVACGQPAPAQSETPAQLLHEMVVGACTHADPTLPDPPFDSQRHPTFPPATRKPSPAPRPPCPPPFNRLPPCPPARSAPA